MAKAHVDTIHESGNGRYMCCGILEIYGVADGVNALSRLLVEPCIGIGSRDCSGIAYILWSLARRLNYIRYDEGLPLHIDDAAILERSEKALEFIAISLEDLSGDMEGAMPYATSEGISRLLEALPFEIRSVGDRLDNNIPEKAA